MTYILNKFHQGAPTIKSFFGGFCRHSIKTWKSWPNFFNFQSMSILAIPRPATDDSKQFHWFNIFSNNKTGPLFLEFSWCEDNFSLFKKIANSSTYRAPLSSTWNGRVECWEYVFWSKGKALFLLTVYPLSMEPFSWGDKNKIWLEDLINNATVVVSFREFCCRLT